MIGISSVLSESDYRTSRELHENMRKYLPSGNARSVCHRIKWVKYNMCARYENGREFSQMKLTSEWKAVVEEWRKLCSSEK